jgi:HD-GYP domain-containing protein (c-di-GMP phosphodiesterase class II)
MSVGEAVEEIKRCADSQFDPVIVAAFLKTVETVTVQASEPPGGAPDGEL